MSELPQPTGGGGKGIFRAVVWPVYAGAVNAAGEEPMSHPDYERGVITWALNEQGRLVGNVRIKIPPGNRDWTHILYCHNQFKPNYSTAQKLHHPFRLPAGGSIELIDITDEDVKVRTNFDPVLHD
jgi:hypothetical protein